MTDDANFQYGNNARVIADSISPEGERVTTIEATMHRFVLAEFNTHRVFSRNSASSRAIPFSKQVRRLEEHPALPVKWASEQRGMQGGDEIDDKDSALMLWLAARNEAIRYATKLSDLGVHKSIVNRLLEPFMWHTVIVTSTEWDNFFHQRVSPLAQPEIDATARAMLEAYESSTPVEVEFGEWHMPYIDAETRVEVSSSEDLRKISAARCARVSYLTHDGKRDVEKDLELYDRLVSADPGHWSPLEHVATPGEGAGNLRGWKQLRHFYDRPSLKRAIEQVESAEQRHRDRKVQRMFEESLGVPFHGTCVGVERRKDDKGDLIHRPFYIARHDELSTDLALFDNYGDIQVYTYAGVPIDTLQQLKQYLV